MSKITKLSQNLLICLEYCRHVFPHDIYAFINIILFNKDFVYQIMITGKPETIEVVCVSGYDDRETRDMLIQIGLEDIVHFPSREQIAFLLVERARLLDELVEAREVYEKTAKDHIVHGFSQVAVA